MFVGKQIILRYFSTRFRLDYSMLPMASRGRTIRSATVSFFGAGFECLSYDVSVFVHLSMRARVKFAHRYRYGELLGLSSGFGDQKN